MSRILILSSILTLTSCIKNTISIGDEVLLQYSIYNMNHQRIDESHLPSGEEMPLRILVGQNYFFEELDKKIIGAKAGQTLNFTLISHEIFGPNDIYYLNNTDTIYVLKHDEKIKIKIYIEKVHKHPSI